MKKKTLPQDMGIVAIGIGLILVGFAVVVIGLLMQSSSSQKTETDTKFSFVGFIGPFPFGFGNDKQWVMTSLVIAMALFFLVMLLFKGAR